MLTILVIGADRSTSRATFDEPEVTFGRGQGNHVVLDGRNISRRHARLVVRDGKYVIVDLKSTNGTYVNGRKLTSPLLVRDHDKIYIGDFTISIEEVDAERTEERSLTPFEARDKVEADLLRAIGELDVGSRAIYADWLEQHGHANEAEFLRIQESLVGLVPEDAGFEPRTGRLRELAQTIDFRWRVRVARPAIERCAGGPAFDFRCPKEWGSLGLTDREDRRHCSACKKDVHYCTSVPEARNHAKRGECVALDLRAERWSRDLGEPFGTEVCRSCRSDIGPAYDKDHCPRCGETIHREVMVGMMA